VRRRIAEILGLSPENTFGLLREIGEDCAGAIAFFAPGRTPSAQGPGDYRELSPEEAARILRELPSRPLDVGEEGFRISGAGAQDKLVACIRGNRIVLPLRGAPSTHIVKAGIPRFPETVPNELLPFDYEAYRSNPGKFYAVVTNVETGKAEYMQETGTDTEWTLLRATCALPLLL
jgi:hypothetical protein